MTRRGKSSSSEHDGLEERLEALRSSSATRHGKNSSGLGAAILGVLLIVGVLGTVYLIYNSAANEQDASGAPAKVRISDGDTLSVVAQKLEEAGAVESALAFELEARVKGAATEIKPGEYQFQAGMSNREILDGLIADRAPPTFTVTIPEGLTAEQTAQRIAAKSNIPATKFEAAARATNYGYAFLENPAIKSTEGFLFPKKYEFEKGTSARQVVDRLLEQYLLETQSLDFSQNGRRPDLSEYEILTIASLIERESANSGERPLIASVIYNRLRKDMKLQIDATVQYAIGQPKEELSLRDLEINSPYNTYQKTGLPPGPICSPSQDSIKAALEPARTDYLYYVLGAEGKRHAFTSTYDEFLRKKAEAGR